MMAVAVTARSERLVRRAQQRLLLHPSFAMLTFWGALYIVYGISPIRQTPSAGIDGTLFNLAFVVLFSVTGWLASMSVNGKSPSVPQLESATDRFDDARLLWILALIGCVGAILSIVGKASEAPVLVLAEAANLRNDRAQQLAGAETVESGLISAIAFLTYPAGYVATFCGLLRYEALSRRLRFVVLVFIPLAFLQSVSSGGRSGILVILVLLATSGYLRQWRGLGFIPRSQAVKWSMVSLLLLFVAYSMTIWLVRSEISSLSSDAFLDHAEVSWGVVPTQNLRDFAEWIGAPGIVQSVLSTIFYFTQSLTVTERLLSMPSVPTLLGGYHIDLAAALLRALPEGRGFLGQGYELLLDANVYGFFTGAWSALYIDFGAIGALLFTALWAYIAGRTHRALKFTGRDSRAALYGFFIYSVAVSFVSPPLGFSNSAVTFAWFLVFTLLSRSYRRPQQN